MEIGFEFLLKIVKRCIPDPFISTEERSEMYVIELNYETRVRGIVS
jgi:hypothetical protein